MSDDQPTARVTTTLHRTVKVLGVDDKPALELTAVDGEVQIKLLPANNSRRSPVRLVDLATAVESLA